MGHDPTRRPRATGDGPDLPDDHGLDVAVQTFALLADRTRLAIVWHLRQGELAVGEIARLVDKPPAAVSQHLGKLRLAGLVATRREGTFVHYRLADSHVGEVVDDALHHAAHLAPDTA